MGKRILVIQGHPDADPTATHFCHALANAYEEAADVAGHSVRVIKVAELSFPILRTEAEWRTGEIPQAILDSQRDISWAEHLVIIYPLWLGTMPALLKAYLEQVMRPGFALDESDPSAIPKQLLKGRSARIVVTMGMPALIYRWFFRAHSLKNLERNMLKFCGIHPVRSSIIGLVASETSHRERWLKKLQRLGQKAS